MCQGVFGEGTLMGKSFTTLLTFKIFNTIVCQGVLGEVRLLGKSFLTQFTFIIFNTTMCQGVFCEGTLMGKSFLTQFTFKIFNTIVCQGVFGEMRLLGKSFLTQFTFIIFNTTMCQGMCVKNTLKFKSFGTLPALKLSLSSVDRAACLELILAITPVASHTRGRLILLLPATHAAAWPHCLHCSTTPGSTHHSWSCKNPRGSWSRSG